MKLPKLFGKKKDEEDEFDEDDFDIEEIADDDLDSDFDDELEEAVGASSAAAQSVDEDAYEEAELSEEEHHAEGHEETEDQEEYEMVGEDGAGDNPFDDMDDEYDDEFDDDDDAEDEAESRKKAIVFAAFGFGVLFLSILGGAGWWFFSGDSEPTVAEKELRPGVVALEMPAAPGSLNAQLSTLNSAASGEVSVGGSTPADGAPAVSSLQPETNSFATASMGEAAPATMNSLNSMNSVGGSNTAGGGMVIPAVASAAMGLIPDQPSSADQSRALSKAPIKALLEEKDGIGDLPKIGPNGSKPWQVYSRPLDPSITEPKIALMIEGVGLSRQASLGAINKLPSEVSIVLSPYARDLDDWVFRARLAGHEVYISMPMESEDFPLEDAGPLALDTRIQLAQNEQRLETVMASTGGYVGLVSMMGSRFMKADGQLRQVLKTINDRGLMFVVGGARSRNGALPIAKELNIAFAESEMYVDAIPRIQQIRTSLDRLEAMAKERGSIIATARPYPVSIKNILDWIATIKDKGVALVPVSAVATLQTPAQ